MALLDEIKVVCRVSSESMDTELEAIIAAAIADMERVGIDPKLLTEDNLHPLARMAIHVYAKARFGYDVDERVQFESSYRSLVVDLLHSQANLNSKRQEPPEDKEPPSTDTESTDSGTVQRNDNTAPNGI